ncbi:MAG: NAD-binding protein [Candidatus Marsarchaeota archaeon]|nr:NAD-binding protein [Candidatus Marsarchaeota archaeon]
MVKLRAIQLVSIGFIVVIFIVSTVLVTLEHYSLLAAALFSFMNIIGADFPPTSSLIDAHSPLVLLSLTLADIANVAFTITFATIFYQVLVGVDIRYTLLNQRLRGVSDHVIVTPVSGIGLELAAKLREGKRRVVFIDENKYEVRKAYRLGYLAVHGDPTKHETLAEARVDSAAAICTLYDDDIKNTLVTIEARRGAKKTRVLSRIGRLEDLPKMERSGALRVVLPEASVGVELGDFLVANS